MCHNDDDDDDNDDDVCLFVCLFLFLLANAGERLEIGDRSAENKRMNVVSAWMSRRWKTYKITTW